MKIAINTEIDYKPTDSKDPAWELLASCFQNVDISSDQLLEHITQGHTFCAHHNGRRSAKTFVCAGFIAVDIDHGITWNEAVANDYVKRFASIMYTTVSHTEKCNRFRIVFELAREITDATEMTHAYNGIIKKFGGDKSCKDPCRMFFGSKDCSYGIFEDNILPTEELDKLIAAGAIKMQSAESNDDGIPRNGSSASRSKHQLDVDQMVKTGAGTVELVSALPKKTSVHCTSPDHIDMRASAMIMESRNAVKGIYCSTCAESFWPKGLHENPLHNFDFYEIDPLLSVMEYEENPESFAYDEVHFEELMNDERMVRSLQSKYLSQIPLVMGVTAIRSPKGTGKSTLLEKIVVDGKWHDYSILLLGHRQSLLTVLAQELNLDCYLDRRDTRGEPVDVSKYFAICLDSVPKLLDPKKHQFDIVIIDESQQVFSHLTSDTLKNCRREAFIKVDHYLKKAKAVIVCDADLSFLTLDTISRARKGDMPSRIYINRYKAEQQTIEMYDSENHLMAELIDTVKSGGRYYVCTNSKQKAKTIARALEQNIPRKLNIQLITSENSQEPEVKEFMLNIKTEILKIDVLITSPSMGTGIDITFENQEKQIDGVFGFFVQQVTSHFDIDQQLCRVRHPKSVKVFISPQKFNFEIEPDVIKRECIANGRVTDTLIGYDDRNDPIFDHDDKMLTLYAEVTALNRASKNNLRKHFIDLKKYNGYEVVEVSRDEEESNVGNEASKNAKESLKFEYANLILMAKKLTSSEVEELKQKKNTTMLDEARLDRYFIEKFYGEEITAELIALDNNKKFQTQIRMMEIFSGSDEYLTNRDAAQLEKVASDRQNSLLIKKLLYDLFFHAGLVDEHGKFIDGKLIAKNELNGFVDVCKQRELDIQNLLGIAIRRGDLVQKPMTQLGQFLKMIGGKWAKVKKADVNGERVIFYQVDMQQIEIAQKYASRRMVDINSPVLWEISNVDGRPKTRSRLGRK